jgi:hypothetical protein
VTVLKPLLKAEAAQQIKDKPSPCSDAKNWCCGWQRERERENEMERMRWRGGFSSLSTLALWLSSSENGYEGMSHASLPWRH